ncbi:MAG: polyprenyl synthetase family protein [Candidatus Omnitrophica bacterium]|nr:polyprenyl synthetase family protein [Candidatus Omnitrophota bacterium]
MRYSVLGEGKRIRPILALAACEAVGGSVKKALPAACALELIHAYSLVHDDLPAMDDDDVRRGRPSCHKKYGEALGVLTGDALLTYSFELLASGGNGDSAVRLKVIREIAKAIGTQGMIGGQVVDIESGSGRSRGAVMEYINSRKTGALISASVRIGALMGGATPKQYQAISSYGDKVGLVFQLVDDQLDRDGAVRLYGVRAVRERAQSLTRSAVNSLRMFGSKGRSLEALAFFILTRNS